MIQVHVFVYGERALTEHLHELTINIAEQLAQHMLLNVLVRDGDDVTNVLADTVAEVFDPGCL